MDEVWAHGGAMRKEAAKLLRDSFDRQFLDGFPCFTKASSKVLPAGMRLYRWRASTTDACAFMILFIDPKYDSFAINLAYSVSGEWIPGAGTVGRLGCGLRNGHYEASIGVLITSGVEENGQWWLEPSPLETSCLVSPPVERSIARIPDAIKDAMEKIRQYAIPEFHRLAGLSGDVLVEE